MEIAGVSVLVAFAAGLLSVASPCVLPMIPAYLGYLTGTSLEGGERPAGAGQITDGRAASTPSPFLHAVSFVSGFSAVFVIFGVSLGVVGFFLRDQQDIILKVAGGSLVILGLHLTGVITIPFLDQERRLNVGTGSKVGYARSFVVGSAFSAGWSPCIGPTLGAILALAVSSGTVAQAAILLLAYAAGLAVPFLALGLAYSSVKPVYTRLRRYLGAVNYASGVFIIIIGILIWTDSIINLNSVFNFGLPGETTEL